MEHDELLRAATYDDAAMVTYLSSTVIATFFHHMRLLVSPDVVLAQIVSTSRGITALKANAIFTTVAMGTRLSLILFLSIIPGGYAYAAGRPDITDFSYMSGPDNNIPIDECESEGSWATLRALLITHYKYAKLNHLIRWVTYKKPVNE